MAEETAEEREARISDEARKLYQDQIDAQREEAESILQGIHDEGPHIETQEEYDQRVAAARASGIFGDTDTTEGAGANQADVVTADNEAATVAVAEADAEGLDVSDDEARRQASADAAVTEEGDVVGTSVTPEESEDFGAAADSDGDELSRTEKIDAIKAAESADEVDAIVADDSRKTVTDAADARKAELA